MSSCSKNRIDILFYFSIALAVSNFNNIGIYLVLLIGLLSIFIKFKGKIIVGKQTVILIVFSVAYMLFYTLNFGLSLTALKVFSLPIISIVFDTYHFNTNENSQKILLIFLALGTALHGILNFIYNLQNGISFNKGQTFDFWSQSLSAATGQMLNFTILVSIIFWIVFLQKNKKLKLIGLTTFIVALIYDIQIGGRTFFVLAITSIFLGAVSYVVISVMEGKKSAQSLWIIMVLVALIVGSYLLFTNNAFGIKTMYENSYLYIRINQHDALANLGKNSRFEIRKVFFENFFVYPFGGANIRTQYLMYAHELWLDVFDDVGLIPYFILILYFMNVIRHYVIYVKDEMISINTRVLILCFGVIMLAQFFVEPILQASPLLLCSFVMVSSSVAGMNRKNKRRIVE